MGLDATVMCNCFRNGKTTPPPCPRDWLALDDEGYLTLLPEHYGDVKFSVLYAWKQTACEHKGLNYAAERIANWSGYRAFQQALDQVGKGRFPVLRAELPNANGGLMPPPAARQALDEVAAFRSLPDLGRNTFLVDSATGEPLYGHIAAYDGVFNWAGSVGLEVGVGEFAFFVREAKTGRRLFQATGVEQTVVGPASEDGRQTVELRDVDTGERFRLPVAIHGRAVPWPDGRYEDDRGRYNVPVVAAFHVEVRPVTPAKFGHILDPLERVFRAAVETGNPVRWC